MSHEQAFCAQPVDNIVDKFLRGVIGEMERYFLIYQEANEDECLLTIQPYDEEQALAEALNRLEGKQNTEYTIIRGRKMNAKLKVAVELSETEEQIDDTPNE